MCEIYLIQKCVQVNVVLTWFKNMSRCKVELFIWSKSVSKCYIMDN